MFQFWRLTRIYQTLMSSLQTVLWNLTMRIVQRRERKILKDLSLNKIDLCSFAKLRIFKKMKIICILHQNSNYLPQGLTNAPIIEVSSSKLKFDINRYLFLRIIKNYFRFELAMLTPPIQKEKIPWSMVSSYFPFPMRTILLYWKGPTPKYSRNLMTL